jgi:hypothetical protein
LEDRTRLNAFNVSLRQVLLKAIEFDYVHDDAVYTGESSERTVSEEQLINELKIQSDEAVPRSLFLRNGPLPIVLPSQLTAPACRPSVEAYSKDEIGTRLTLMPAMGLLKSSLEGDRRAHKGQNSD